ncbi:hypothetical protein CRENBAI_005004 [Crenichthys baileyi]|uniref:Uncharacterized protein n=1 Tax=Crenichthys baileyi TaxID=28760 RepID=A0AAV9SQZ7_9TELE
MTEGTSQRDQAAEREFKRGEILVKLFSHLATSPSSPWRRLEIAGSLQDWLEARKDFFPDPRIHHIIEAERQRAPGEIAASMWRPPAPSSARLSTEAGGGFLAHGDLHGLAEGPSGLCTDRLGSSGFHTAPLLSTVGSPGPAAGRQITSSYVAGRLIVFYVAGLLIAGSARDGLRASHLNSGSAAEVSGPAA